MNDNEVRAPMVGNMKDLKGEKISELTFPFLCVLKSKVKA